jgi:CheY-like chemotaxis protein
VGTGLGLSTVYGIVKQLGGFIAVDSEVGKGTTFRIFLPASNNSPEIVHTTAKPGPVVVGRETILLVEDEEAVRRFAKHALERHGFDVVEAASPEQALSIAATIDRPIDLLLTDVVMPHLSGPELAERLHKARPDLPVLYMSGYPASMVMQGAQPAASVRLLPKPFTTAALLANVDEALRRKRGNP